jgi:hypothetical protein
METKTFVFMVVEGASVVRLEKRRRNFSGLALLGARSLGWLGFNDGDLAVVSGGGLC